MFSQEIAALERQIDALDQHPDASEVAEAVEAAAQGADLDLAMLSRLLWIDPMTQRDAYLAVCRAAEESRRRRFGGQARVISPLYVTSICQENCSYCNYRAGNREADIVRVRLTPEELEQEARFLIHERGLRAVELVYATDPKLRVPQICEHARILRGLLDEVGGGVVGLNAEPFDVEEYAALREAGVDFVAVWQETYQRDAYAGLHSVRHKKGRYDYRVDCFERMLLGGFRAIGIGVLSGLAPWRKDWLLLMAHERYLQRVYGVSPAILGTPRLKPAAGAEIQSTPHLPSDDEFLLAIAVHKLAFPESLPWVSTRESWDLCTQAAAGGGVLFTLDCSTLPGGYTVRASGYQFPVNSFDSRLYTDRLRRLGIEPTLHWRLPSPAASSQGTIRCAPRS